MPKPGFYRIRKNYRDVLIKLATEVFNSKEYKSLKVADFCRGMDLPAGTFYEYFENMEDLCVYLASLTFQKKFDELGKNNIALFTYEEEGFVIEKKEENPPEITYEKILHCGIGFFAKLFDEYLLDMMTPFIEEGIRERMADGRYRDDIDINMASYLIALLSTFDLHYFDKYQITEEKKQEEAIVRLLGAVDLILKRKEEGKMEC